MNSLSAQLDFDRKADTEPQEFFDKRILPSLKKNGKWYGRINKDDYHMMPGVSNSKLKDFLDDPFKIWFLKTHPEIKRPEQTHFEVGKMLHEALLENKILVSDHDIIGAIMLAKPDTKKPRATKDYKLAKEQAEERGATLVDHETYVMFRQWKESIRDDTTLDALFRQSDGYREKSIFVIDPETGLILKCSPDIHVPSKNLMADAKFMAGRFSWSKEIEKYRYDIQQVFYQHCLRLYVGEEISEAFPFLHFIKSIPFKMSIKKISDASLELAQLYFDDGLKRMKFAYEKNQWGSCLEDSVEESSPTNWLLNNAPEGT